MKKIIPYIIGLLLMAAPALATTSIKYSQLTSGGNILTTDKFPVLRTLAVSGAADNGSGLIRLTVATMTGLGIATNDLLSVSGVGGTTEANGQWAVTVVNATHLDLQASTFTHAYTTGGQVNFNPSVAVNTLATLAAAPAGTLTGATLASGVTASSLTSVGAGIALGTPASVVLTNATGTAAALSIGGNAGTVTNGIYTTDTGTVTNTMLLNPATTVNGQTCTLGSTCTISAAASLVVGSTSITSGTDTAIEFNNAGTLGEYTVSGTGSVCMTTSCSMTTPALGTPSALVATNATGTASGLTAGTATNAVNAGITDDTTTNATMYPTWVTANTGNLPQKVTSTKLSFNPSTGALSSTSFTGAGTGLTGTAASLTSGLVTDGVYTTDTGTVTNTMLAGSIALTKLATQATNTVVGNATSGSAAPTALAVGTCSTAGSALNWTTNTGFGCNTSITAAAVPASGLTGATLASSVTASSLVSTGTLTGGATGTGFTIALGSSTITGTLPAANNETNLRHTSIGATFNGGGSAIAANSKQWVYVPYGTIIQSWTIGCDASGSIAFDVQMDTYANFSTSMTSIAGTDFPTVTTATKAQDLVLTGWGTTAIPAGDYILFKVTSATTVTNCNIVLDTIRT